MRISSAAAAVMRLRNSPPLSSSSRCFSATAARGSASGRLLLLLVSLLLLLPRRIDGFAATPASLVATTTLLPLRHDHDDPSVASLSSPRRRRRRFPSPWSPRRKKNGAGHPHTTKQQQTTATTTTALRSSAFDDDEKKKSITNKDPTASTEDGSTQQPQQQPQQQQQQIDWTRVREQLQLFRQMAAPYYKEAPRARWLLATVLVLTLANSGISVLFSYVGKDFWNALSAKDVETFGVVLGKYVAALSIGAPVATLYKYQREQLAVHWREWMTARTFDLYVENKVYYNLQLTSKDNIDNPDQRIAEDVRTFTSFSLSLLITCLTSVIDLVAFASILWSIYPQLFVAIVLYAGLGTVITAYLGRALVHLNFRQLRAEADLRYSLVRLRDNAESIAFYGGEDLEGQCVERRVELTMDNRRRINAAQRNLEFFTNAYRYLVQILPVAVVAPRYFAGAIELGVISQSAGAFNHILSDLSIIVNQFEQLSTFSAGVERLSSFYEAMRAADPQRDAATSPLLQPVRMVNETTPEMTTATATAKETLVRTTNGPTNETAGLLPTKYAKHDFGEIALDRWINGEAEAQSIALSIEHLDLGTPDGKRQLIRDLNLQLRQGQHLLIVGNSGAGKSSLLRAIAGLWTTGNGRIARPADDDVYFLPQRPYCTVGSLKDQLLYPTLDFNETEILANGEQQRDGATTTTGSSRKPDKGNKILPRSHWLKQAMTDQDFIDVLTKVDLLDVAVRAGDGDATKGLGVTLDWSNILSLGEQQRLAFGRLLVNRPRLVIVDEATSALDIGAEARMYSILQEMAQRQVVHGKQLSSAPGLTYISVGHRPSLVIFHDKKLRLGGGDAAEHELSDIEKSAAQLAIGQEQQIM